LIFIVCLIAGSERQELLQSLLRAEEDDDEEENEVPDDEIINQMIARSVSQLTGQYRS
jgi:SWI/SNF-related matrix-associated actin-dependent regulator of chromatin subfamily A protein 2/4